MSEKQGLTRAHWMVLIAAFAGWMFDGLEMGLFPLVARPALQDLLGPVDEGLVGWWNAAILFCFLMGAALGGLLFGWLGDKIGRVRSMLLSVLCYSGFTGLCYFAGSPWELGGLRFLAALGMGGEWSLGVALVMECWPEKLRPLMAGIIGAAANVGFLLISVLGMNIQVTEESWRWMMIAGAAPAILTIFIRLFVPESDRWKESVKEASSKPVREIFSKDLLRPTILAISFASIALIGTWGALSGFLPLWTDQLAGGDRMLKVEMRIGKQAPKVFARSVNVVQIEFTPAVETQAGFTGRTFEAGRSLDFDVPPGPDAEFVDASYTLTVTNRGDQAVTDVTVTDWLPVKHIDLKGVSLRGAEGAKFDAKTGVLTWTMDEMPGGERTLEVVMRIRQGAQQTFARPVDVVEFEAAPLTDSGEAKDLKGPAFQIKRIAKFEGVAPEANEGFVYTLRVTNRGDRAATQVVVTDKLPVDQIDLASVSIQGEEDATLDAESGVITWTVRDDLEYKDPYAKATCQFAISIGAIIGCLAAPLLGGYIGRRPAYFGLCLSSLIVCSVLFNCMTEYNMTFLLLSGLAGMTTASFFGWLPLYLPELFPTRVRATGQGVSFNFGRVAAALAVLGTGMLMILVGNSYPKACAIVSLIYLVGMVLIWFAPETKGKPLPD